MQLRLIVLNGPQTGRQCQFDSEWVGQWLLLGRSRESALPLHDSVMVSVRHAVVRVEDDGFYLLDQQSTNGTMVNGQRVQRVKLRSEDVIQLGTSGPQLRVVIESVPRAIQYNTNVSAYDTNPAASAAAAPPPPPKAPPVIMPSMPSIHTFGLYQPENDSGKVPRSLGLAVAALFGVALGLVLLTLTLRGLGIVTTVIAVSFAFVPAIFYLSMFLWLDRFDPEPFGNLAFAFGWGALFAILVSGIVNTLFGVAASNVVSAQVADTLTGVVSAPLIEESTKGVGVVLIWLMFRKDFDSIVDGIVYAGVVALGFAAMENVDYYGRSFNEEGIGGLVSTFILRGILSPFSHVLFTCMTGIGCGYARESHQAAVRWIAPIVGFVGAMFLHAVWNTLASFRSETFFFGYFVFQVPLFILFVTSFVYLVRREGRILQQSLTFEVQRGLISAEQLNMLVSLFGRTRWVMAAAGNSARMEARRQFLRAASKLGLCHWHVSRAVSAQSQTASFPVIPRLQAELLALRSRI